MVEHHGIFQGYYFWHHIGMDRNTRDQYADHRSTTTPRSSAPSTTRRRSTPSTRAPTSTHYEPLIRKFFVPAT